MKKFLILLAAFILVASISVMAADVSDLIFDDESATPAISASGYPRFEFDKNNVLLLFNVGTVRKSTDNGSTWTRKTITQNSATTAVSASGKTHNLARENWQGFLCEDGSIIVAYRSRTKDYTSGEFYTSIRFMTSTDNANTFNNEVIVAEKTTNSFNGYWEPFMIQPDSDTVLIFYSDDLNVRKPSSQQNIVYHEYNLKTKTISDAIVAVNGESRNSRDGMPVITKLLDGGYAMVIETHDYLNRTCSLTNTYGNSVFVIDIVLSKDGRNWGNPIPVVAPANLKGGGRCAAPYITTLPDGRVVISYMTTDGYKGISADDASKSCVYGAVISNTAIKSTDTIAPTKGGVAEGFTALPDIFTEPENGYIIWNTVFCKGDYIYFSGSAGTNDGSVASSVRIRRADISALKADADIDDNGEVNLKDVLLAFKAFSSSKMSADLNNNGRTDILDIIAVLAKAL